VSARILGGLATAALILALAACSGGTPDALPDERPGGRPDGPVAPIGTGLDPACATAFELATKAPDLADAAVIPSDWPAAPEGSTLCVVLQTSDENAVLQYLTTATPDEVLDAWEPLLSQYELVRGDGIGGNPILNATSADLEFAIQTDAGTGTYVVGFGSL
jgi:hypothetical protein